ncbi:2',5'-phosphodiesterase 12 [Alosa alosa]|uniref:2',5'-phosphodiesterase 12 n=1 Tax=Alosa alosa TaxID=278164 RepID=UPI0020151C7A|nr:2',5'-phosphodiesterase 12 [Alosa alosa]
MLWNFALRSRLFVNNLISISLWDHHSSCCLRYYKTMERAVVRCVPSEVKLTISFLLYGSQKHMLRDQSEELGKVLARISNGIIRTQGKGKKSKKKQLNEPCEAVEPIVRLHYNGDYVANDVSNFNAWQDGAVLHIGEIKYKIERNPPTFITAELPVAILAGFPVCPKLEIEFGDLNDSVFTWFKARDPNQDSWIEAGTGRVFTPSNGDIGLKVKFNCIPGNQTKYGAAKELVSSSTVEAGPGVCTFDTRHLYTKKVTDNSKLRVVSYNILADIYAQTDLSKTVLYPYCPPYALGIDYRQSLIKKELMGYNADIICLQEVDKAVFNDSLSPALDASGMEGVFKIKEKQHEGLATYFRKSKLQLLSQHDIMLSEALRNDPLHSDLLDNLSKNPILKDRVMQRSTTLQVTVLQPLSNCSKPVCVANTHLYWHPKGGNVRLIQIDVALRHLKQVISVEHPGASLLFFGDFNSIPSSGLFQLLSQGTVPKTHPDWTSGGPDEQCPMELHNPFQLQSACGEPSYTNYVGGFHGCLDYIFLDPQMLCVEQVIPMPSHDEVTTYQALPSVSHPSDHIALVCDLKWK